MNDDVKAARESIKEFRDWAQRLNQLARHSKDGMSNSLIAADNQRAIEVKTKALLAHIDGEPARIAAACEEVREAVARHVMGPALKRDPDLFADHLEEVYAATIRRMPLTATPLADEIAALRARVAALERERDMLQTALRDNSAAHSETGKALLRAEAQVTAARAECERILDSMYSAEYRYAADHVLAAMDGAKP